jgi:Ca2+-binding RTX toxin-like protein
MYGGAGNDTMLGGRGDDFMDGGAGNDGLDGYTGSDLLIGQAGNDRLIGGRDRDVLIGGQDKDLLYGGDESDLMIADITEADGDEAALRGLLELWLMSTVSPEAGDDILAYLDDLDDLEDGITQDNSLVDLMDGGPNTDDLYFRFGTRDILYRVNADDVVVVL